MQILIFLESVLPISSKNCKKQRIWLSGIEANEGFSNWDQIWLQVDAVVSIKIFFCLFQRLHSCEQLWYILITKTMLFQRAKCKMQYQSILKTICKTNNWGSMVPRQASLFWSGPRARAQTRPHALAWRMGLNIVIIEPPRKYPVPKVIGTWIVDNTSKQGPTVRIFQL